MQRQRFPRVAGLFNVKAEPPREQRERRAVSSRWLGNLLPTLGWDSRKAELWMLATLPMLILGMMLFVVGVVMNRPNIISTLAVVPVIFTGVFFVVAIIVELRTQNWQASEEESQEKENRDPKC
jgi:lipopolysaccharide export LptBFGC system permease protein LptF